MKITRAFFCPEWRSWNTCFLGQGKFRVLFFIKSGFYFHIKLWLANGKGSISVFRPLKMEKQSLVKETGQYVLLSGLLDVSIDRISRWILNWKLRMMKQTLQFQYKGQLIELVNVTENNECLAFENDSWRMEITYRDEISFQIRIKYQNPTISPGGSVN